MPMWLEFELAALPLAVMLLAGLAKLWSDVRVVRLWALRHQEESDRAMNDLAEIKAEVTGMMAYLRNRENGYK